MIKLWNHGLLDASTMNNCSIILNNFRNEGSDAGKNWRLKGIFFNFEEKAVYLPCLVFYLILASYFCISYHNLFIDYFLSCVWTIYHIKLLNMYIYIMKFKRFPRRALSHPIMPLIWKIQKSLLCYFTYLDAQGSAFETWRWSYIEDQVFFLNFIN